MKRKKRQKFNGFGGMDPLTAARPGEQQSLGAVSWPSDTGEQYAVVVKGRDFAKERGCVPATGPVSSLLEPLSASQHSRVLLVY